jgi:hypothetical protein
MPFLDAWIPEGALTPDAERALAAKIAALLIEHEGVDPAEPSMGGDPRETAERLPAERRRASAEKIVAAAQRERPWAKTIEAQGST